MKVQEFRSSEVQKFRGLDSTAQLLNFSPSKRLTSIMLLVTCLLLLSGCAANRAFKEGSKTAASGDADGAVLHYQKALSLEPNNLSYRIELEKARSIAAIKHFSTGNGYLQE